MKIAVVGAGPAGLACAWQIAKSGHEVTLIERMAELSSQGSGILFQPIGLKALDIMGIRQEIEALGHKIEKIEGTIFPSGLSLIHI